MGKAHSLRNNINWHTVYSTQKNYQKRLVAEYRNNTNMAGVNRLQREILENKNMRISAVKRVTTNKGGSTPGVDGII
jgi:retron-type reverse transcriptase